MRLLLSRRRLCPRQTCPHLWNQLTVSWVLLALLAWAGLAACFLEGSDLASTCRYRTVNYITHQLPQQCLRSMKITSATHTEEKEPVSDFSPVSDPALSSSATSSSTNSAFYESLENSNTINNMAVEPTNDYEHAKHTITDGSLYVTTRSSPIVVSVPTPMVSKRQGSEEVELDAFLDNSGFLSFDEWKSQNLAGSGSSGVNDKSQKRSSSGTNDESMGGSIMSRKLPVQDHSLDSFGDDLEIDISIFRQAPDMEEETLASKVESRETDSLSKETNSRLKFAGKTSKERFNYASFDCAATILKSNPEVRGASSILVENKDSYMLNPCSVSNKFVIIELCQEIQVDTVVLANYEFFSSMVHKFRVSVSDRYPVKVSGWKVLGEFEAQNARVVQPFLVKNPLIWARYLRIEFLSHWGHEFYCPLSLIRIHGITMMEEYRYQEELGRGEEDEREEVVPEAVALEILPESLEQRYEEGSEALDNSEDKEDSITEFETNSGTKKSAASIVSESPDTLECAGRSPEKLPVSSPVSSSSHFKGNFTMSISYAATLKFLRVCDRYMDDPSQSAYSSIVDQMCTSNEVTANIDDTNVKNESRDKCSLNIQGDKPSVIEDMISMTNVFPHENLEHNLESVTEVSHSHQNRVSVHDSSTDTADISATASLVNEHDVSDSDAESLSTMNVHNANFNPHSNDGNTGSQTSTALSPNPTSQESVYKTIMKRLSLLEANASLSLQYIEEQSRMLREAFTRAERRQNIRVAEFLDVLNSTVLNQLINFKQQYEQLWQSTVIELETNKETVEKEMVDITTRLGIVVDELVYQKRVTMVQSVILLVLLLFALMQGSARGRQLLDYREIGRLLGMDVKERMYLKDQVRVKERMD
ncbi:UNC-like C-terminal-domain-containing protein [Dipodascopsis uninucleata]